MKLHIANMVSLSCLFCSLCHDGALQCDTRECEGTKAALSELCKGFLPLLSHHALLLLYPPHPLFSPPQWVVRVDAVLPLCTLNLPPAKHLPGWNLWRHSDALNPETFSGLFGSGLWSSSPHRGWTEPVSWADGRGKALSRCWRLQR